MKTKKFNKRLTLNKSTVVNLNNSDMSKVYGGEWTDPGECIRTVNFTKCANSCTLCPTEWPSKCPILC